MAAKSEQITVELAVEPTGEALAAYEHQVLDQAVGLRLNHATGALTAVVKVNGTERLLGCGTVSTRIANQLRKAGSVIWARLHRSDVVAVTEIRLEHA